MPSDQNQRGKLLPTPPLPKGLPSINLTENSKQILTRRYQRRGDNGEPVESIDEMFWRVAYHIAKIEDLDESSETDLAKAFYILLSSKSFFPNSPTFTGAGTPLGQLAACFVLPISDDMGRNGTGIFESLRNAALIQQTGGGNGFSFSRLRPSGAVVKSSAGKATGPIGFLRVYDHAFDEIAQGGTRRGANMATLRVDHPDIEEFVTCKAEEHQITNFNISVGITDAFMRSVENDDEWPLRFPDISDSLYGSLNGTLEDAEEQGINIVTYKTVRARDLFAQIVKQAHHNGEPGVLFLDAANRQNPVPHLYRLESTNPCGEQWLGPFENCCLGSINMAQHFGSNGTVDWDKLQYSVELSTRFLDDVVDANMYVPAVPQLKEAAMRARRIGLGIMGLADILYHVGIRYGSIEGQEFASQLMEFVRYHSMKTSIQLAAERGSFPAIVGSLYDPDNLAWTAPDPIVPHVHDWGRPACDWESIVSGIKKHGIRNAAQLTIAPTGTIATVAGLEGYGCEPVFALAYIRHVNDNGNDLQLTYASPLFQAALDQAHMSAEEQEKVITKVMELGSCQNIQELPDSIRDVFVVSSDITAEEHVRMQAAMQAFVDNSLSKTINFPSTATESDVADAYMLAWKLGCKGITVYVTGSRETVVLETKSTADKKEPAVEAPAQLAIWHDDRKPRPRTLPGYTYSIETPLGKAFVTVNENGGNQPFEVFINSAKAGSDTAAVSEAIGRLISQILRQASPIEPLKRLELVIKQLNGIGGGRSMGFGPNRVRSFPDGVSQVLQEYVDQRKIRLDSGHINLHQESLLDFHAPNTDKPAQLSLLKIGDLCPDCGQATLVMEEGCCKCHSCGYSEC
ncbi:MAG: adenosylcobalamin-dependent ribonucleoside-diphosphate reductase [Anaerolineae bacterium]|nr:adenosylcobalamin-dependent ribonucleoside-diphosphate reductase [Anaerolineae bacterium]